MKREPVWHRPQRAAAQLEVQRPVTPAETGDEDEPGLILGRPAGSKLEWYVALGLETLEYEFEYQVPIRGGRDRMGGQILDFLVHTPGKFTPVDTKGAYWHTGVHDDRYELERALRGMNYRDIVEIWDDECPDKDAAIQLLRKRLG